LGQGGEVLQHQAASIRGRGKLNAAVTDALADANVRARLADLGQEIFPREQQAPEALAALQRADTEKWWPIVKAAGIKGE
jgi:tripartite-type tricarboxylate transporter receptor subunit TctC